jgi:hypothetical protein
MGYWDNVTPHSVANAADGFKEFRIGDNDAFVKLVREKYSESGNPMLVITFGNDEGAEIKHFIVDGEYKLRKLKQFYQAFGIPFGSRDFEGMMRRVLDFKQITNNLESVVTPYLQEYLNSIEGYGILVSELAQKACVNYDNGENTITYFGSLLFNDTDISEMKEKR